MIPALLVASVGLALLAVLAERAAALRLSIVLLIFAFAAITAAGIIYALGDAGTGCDRP